MTAPTKPRFRYLGEVWIRHQQVSNQDNWLYAVLANLGPIRQASARRVALIPLRNGKPPPIPPCPLNRGERPTHSYTRWVGRTSTNKPIWRCWCGQMKHIPGRFPSLGPSEK